MQKNGVRCLVVNVSDRFGDYGLVGVVFYQFKLEVIVIDNYILSCRALGFGVEHSVLSRVSKWKIMHLELITRPNQGFQDPADQRIIHNYIYAHTHFMSILEKVCRILMSK